MKSRLGGFLLAAACLSGCQAASSTRVTSSSIVTPPAPVNLLQGETTGGLKGWAVIAPPEVRRTVSVEHGRYVLTLSNRGRPVRGPVLIARQLPVLPETGVGAVYLLRERIRSSGLRRPVQTELKLGYASGGYTFFGAARLGLTPAGTAGQAVAGSTSGWITVQARATAALPLTSLLIYALDSLPMPRFAGSISVEEPQLFALPGHSS